LTQQLLQVITGLKNGQSSLVCASYLQILFLWWLKNTSNIFRKGIKNPNP